MSFEFCTLADLAAPIKNAIVGGPFGSNLVSKDYVERGIPVIRGQNMGGKWISGDFVYVSDEKAQALSQNTARPNDLIFTQRGTLGQVSIVPQGQFDKYIVSQSQMKITLDTNKADVTFLYYLFRTPDQLQYIFNSAIQTGVPHTNLGILRATPIQLPPLPVQKKISAVMNVLDDRIALLRETNATLEAIAQALFKSWFVDFDPVRAKASLPSPCGRGAGGEGIHIHPHPNPLPEGEGAVLPPEIAALFPDSFEESELGLVPKGWSTQRLEMFIELAYGKALKSTDRVPGDVPVYGSGGITGYHNKSLADGPSIIVGRKGTVGSLYWEDSPFFPIDTVFFVKSATPMTYCFYLLQMLGLNGMNTDAAVPGLNRNNVYRLTVPYPTREVLEAFDSVAKVIRERIFRNQQQAQALATLRDTLLPRLISGRLRLPEAEASIEESL
jgi:type I restriction enzyme S subunit